MRIPHAGPRRRWTERVVAETTPGQRPASAATDMVDRLLTRGRFLSESTYRVMVLEATGAMRESGSEGCEAVLVRWGWRIARQRVATRVHGNSTYYLAVTGACLLGGMAGVGVVSGLQMLMLWVLASNALLAMDVWLALRDAWAPGT